MAHFGNGKVRHSNNKNSYINDEDVGIAIGIVQDEFFKAVIMPTDKDPKNERILRKAVKDKIYALAPKVASQFEPGYDPKALKGMVHEVAKRNGLRVRLSPEEIEALNAKRQEAAERREFQAMLRKQEDEIASKIAIQFIRLLTGVHFRAGWQKEKCLRMCVNNVIEQFRTIGGKALDGANILKTYEDCLAKFDGATETHNY